MANLRQNNTNRVAGFITQGPRPIADLDTFRASVIKPPQHAVKLTHRYQLSQQAPKVWRNAKSVNHLPDSANLPGLTYYSLAA